MTKDAFITPLLKDFDFNTSDPSLRKRFEEQNKAELEKMWQLFLLNTAIEEAIAKHPRLLTPLDQTPLSNRAKNCLKEYDIKTVADISMFSLAELKIIRNMGKTSLAEIEAYMKEVIGEK